MQIFWDFLRYGVPVTTAVTGGMLASSKGWKSASVVGAVAAGWGAGWFGQYLLSKVLEPSMEQLPVASINPNMAAQTPPAPSADQVMNKVAGRAATKGTEAYTPTLRGKDGKPEQEGVVIDMQTQKIVETSVLQTPPPTPMGTSGFDPGGSFGSTGAE